MARADAEEGKGAAERRQKEEEEGGGWFRAVDPCCYTYDALVPMYLAFPQHFTTEHCGGHR